MRAALCRRSGRDDPAIAFALVGLAVILPGVLYARSSRGAVRADVAGVLGLQAVVRSLK
jgi:hypothetical protein